MFCTGCTSGTCISGIPDRIFSLVSAFFEWYETSKKALNPVELVALAHLKFVTIHPFGDGNGSVSIVTHQRLCTLKA